MYDYYVVARTREEVVHWCFTNYVQQHKVCFVNSNERIMGIEISAAQLICLSHNPNVDMWLVKSRIRKPQTPQPKFQQCLLLGGPFDGQKRLIDVNVPFWKVIDIPELGEICTNLVSLSDAACISYTYRRSELREGPDSMFVYVFEALPQHGLMRKLLQGYRGSGSDLTIEDPESPY